MKEFTELQRTPSLNHVSAQSPRVGGCVGTFFHMFDWNPSKKRCATKRLPAGINASSRNSLFFPRNLSESLNHLLLEFVARFQLSSKSSWRPAYIPLESFLHHSFSLCVSFLVVICIVLFVKIERLEEEHYVRRERSLKESNVKRSLVHRI